MKRIKNYLKELKTKLILKYHSCDGYFGYFGNYICIDEYKVQTVDKGCVCTTTSSTHECKICGHIEHVD